jgi:hypothetical protein
VNYLRLIATASGERGRYDVNALRETYPGRFDGDLVALAAMGKMPNAGPEGPAVEQYFIAQCELFGLDPKTFLPQERR